MNSPTDNMTTDTHDAAALAPYTVTPLDSLAGTIARAQSALVGQLVEFHGQYFRVTLCRRDTESELRPLMLTCEVAGTELGVTFSPDFSRGWLGDNQITREQLDNPLIVDVYADYLISTLPPWVTNVKLGGVLRSAIQCDVTLTPAQGAGALPIELNVTVEDLDAWQRVFDHVQQYCVLAEHQRLDALQVALPLVAATVTLSSDELASLSPSDIIRLT